ncbi:DUF4386 domain-containing protein [Pseudokineococcus sp. 5B2Z-1]|uniref:DUF4386 domain-containing protein n=1 Tax=Pseudokineococcus sp. 5B2Z-1 TaxID=3132744 RepID=UPI0030A32ECB
MTARTAAPRAAPAPAGPPAGAAPWAGGAGATTSPRRAALVAGSGYAGIFVLAVLANFVVLEDVRGAGDPAAVARAVADREVLVRAAAAAFLLVAVLDVVVAWALDVLLAPVHRDLSRLAAWLRLVHAVLMGAGASVLVVAAGPAGGGTTTPAQRAQQVGLLLEVFDVLWLAGLLAFGVHLVLLAVLLGLSRRAPVLLGAVLAVAGGAYATDTLARYLLPAYEDVAAVLLVVVAVPSVLGELALTVWLLVRGGRRVAGSAPAPARAPRGTGGPARPRPSGRPDHP